MNEGLNAEYRQNPGPTEKVLQNKRSGNPYRLSTIKYNTINTGTSEIFSEPIVASKCGRLARIEKQAMLLKLDLLYASC